MWRASGENLNYVTLAPQERPSGEILNYLLSHYSDILLNNHWCDSTIWETDVGSRIFHVLHFIFDVDRSRWFIKVASLSSEESETNSFYFQDKTQVNFFSNWKCLIWIISRWEQSSSLAWLWQLASVILMVLSIIIKITNPIFKIFLFRLFLDGNTAQALAIPRYQ